MTATDAFISRYPHMRFATQWSIDGDLQYLLGQSDALVDAISRAPLLPRFREALHGLSMRKGAQATTAIEGNTLSDEEIERVALGESLPPSQEYQQREVENILAAFNTLLTETTTHNRADLISSTLLLRFHEMIGRELGEHFGAIPGKFAQTQRVVGGVYRPPAPEDVPPLVEKLCEWLQREFHYPQQRFSDAVVQAIVTHVYIEWIHPFDDGNGRTGRLVEFYILMRKGLPSIASHLLANHYNDTRPEYYRQLQRAKQDSDLTAFLRYAVVGLRDGLVKALRAVQENALEQMWRVLVYDKFGTRTTGRGAFTRQRDVALALPLGRPIRFSDVPDLTPELTAAYAGSTPRTVLRDLSELARLELIVREPGLVRANRALLDGSLPGRRKPLTGEDS